MMRSRWWLVVLWVVLIEALVLWPSPPEFPQPVWMVGLDKLVHAALFAELAALAAWALQPSGRPVWMAWVGAVLFGALTEGQQHFLPSRSMELGDFLADIVGATIGLALFAALARERRELSR